MLKAALSKVTTVLIADSIALNGFYIVEIGKTVRIGPYTTYLNFHTNLRRIAVARTLRNAGISKSSEVRKFLRERVRYERTRD